MNSKQIFLASLMALATGAALADGGDIGASNYPVASASNVARATIKSDVLAARADGELRPTGELGDMPYVAKAAPSTLSRQDVKLATLQAAKSGQLMPAGQETFERPTGESTPHASYGSARNLLTAFERKFSSN